VALLGLALVAVLPPVVVTQVLVGPNHDFGSDAAIVGTPAGAMLLGLLVLARVRGRRGPLPGPVTLLRLWRLIALAWVVATVAEAVVAAFELAGSPFLGSTTAWLFVARFVLLALLAPLILRGLA